MKIRIEIDEGTASNLHCALGVAEGALLQQGLTDAAAVVHRTFIAVTESETTAGKEQE